MIFLEFSYLKSQKPTLLKKFKDFNKNYEF